MQWRCVRQKEMEGKRGREERERERGGGGGQMEKIVKPYVRLTTVVSRAGYYYQAS
jgi:hypothetical protein